MRTDSLSNSSLQGFGSVESGCCACASAANPLRFAASLTVNARMAPGGNWERRRVLRLAEREDCDGWDAASKNL